MDFYTLLQIIIGFFGLIIIALPLSDNYKIINYKYVLYGILSQILLAAILLKVPLVISAFEILGNGVNWCRRRWFRGFKQRWIMD